MRARSGHSRGAVERPVVLDPAANDRVDLLGDLGHGEGDLAVQPPPADFTADLLEGWLADRGQERGELDPGPWTAPSRRHSAN
jgi:hypothetical protein